MSSCLPQPPRAALSPWHTPPSHTPLCRPRQDTMRLLMFTVCSSFLSSLLCNFYLVFIFNIWNHFFLEAFPACVPQVQVWAGYTPCDIRAPGFILLWLSARRVAHLLVCSQYLSVRGISAPPVHSPRHRAGRVSRHRGVIEHRLPFAHSHTRFTWVPRRS